MPVLHDAYPSRVFDQPQLLPRRDPVVYADRPAGGGLSPDQVAFYEENGYLFLKQFFREEEVDVLLREMRRLAASGLRQGDEVVIEPESDIVRSIFRVHALSLVFDSLCRDPRLLQMARFLVGDEVYIHQSRVNLKPGFRGKEFYWHSDFETWHVEDGMPRMRALSMSIALTENNEFNGPLMVVPGSHRHYVACVGRTPEHHYLQSLRQQEYGVPDDDSLARLVAEGGIVAPKGPGGSVVIFDCNTMHGSNSNISPYPRSNVFCVYNSVENALQEPFGGQPPRPESIAARGSFVPLTPAERGFVALAE